jgi:hypothetical protein
MFGLWRNLPGGRLAMTGIPFLSLHCIGVNSYLFKFMGYIEIYGQWTNDETRLETELLMSLA